MDPTELMTQLRPQVATLYHIMRAMQVGATLGDRVSAVLTATVQAIGLKGGTVRLLTPDRERLDLVAAYGLSESYLAKGQIEVARSGLDQLVLEGDIVSIDDVTTDPRFQYPQAAAAEGIRSILALPLRFGKRIVGVMRVYAADSHRFPREERAFLAAIADAAGASMENAQMHEALLDIAQAINSALKLEDVLLAILQQTVVDLGLRAGAIRLLNAETGTLPLVAAYGLSEAYINKGTIEVARSQHDQRILAGNIIATHDLLGSQSFQYADAVRREGLASSISFPLRAHDRVIGLMRIYTAIPHTFTPRETEFLTAVAQLGATAIENARLYETLQAQNKNLEADLQAWYTFVG